MRWPRRPQPAAAIGAFLVSRQAANCTPATLTWYGHMLRPIATAYPDRLPSRSVDLEQLLATIPGSDSTKVGHWRAWRVFFRWCKESLGVADPMQRVKRPQRRPSLPKALTDLQVDQLLAANRKDERELAMITLMLDTGIRVGELGNMNRDDIRINGADCTIVVTGKTGQREIPISDGTRQLLMRLPVNGPHIWSHSTGKRLKTNGAQQALIRAFKRAALKGHPHMLRHTFGKLFIRNGGNVFSLQKIMGHSDITMTRIYVEMNRQDVAEEHARYSPMAQRFRLVQPTHTPAALDAGP